MCRLKGLEIMNDDPSEVDVLYAKIDDPTGRLQLIADRVYEWMMDSEPRFLQDKFDHLDNVKLHVTLMNSRYRKGEEVGEEDWERSGPVGGGGAAAAATAARRTFDAKDILTHFSDFDFGEVLVKEVHISQRFSSGPDGFYQATRKLSLDGSLFRGNDPPSTERPPVYDHYSDEPSCG